MCGLHVMYIYFPVICVIFISNMKKYHGLVQPTHLISHFKYHAVIFFKQYARIKYKIIISQHPDKTGLQKIMI